MNPTDYELQVGVLLRGCRLKAGLSLNGVQEKSGGKWKAGTVGSYERGQRGLTLGTFHELATWYGVKVVDLLPDALEAQVGAAIVNAIEARMRDGSTHE
jgi:transcriptional regulator with XRE-family HTH domain